MYYINVLVCDVFVTKGIFVTLRLVFGHVTFSSQSFNNMAEYCEIVYLNAFYKYAVQHCFK
jgi:hypothetical protein